MSWTKEQRKIAKDKKKWLISIAYDGRPGKKGGGFAFTAACTDGEYKILSDAIIRILDLRKRGT